MLTSFCWVPNGGMKPVPIRTDDDPETVKQKYNILEEDDDDEKQLVEEAEATTTTTTKTNKKKKASIVAKKGSKQTTSGKRRGLSGATLEGDEEEEGGHQRGGEWEDCSTDESSTEGVDIEHIPIVQGRDNIIDQVESDDEDEVDDTTFRPTDLVFITARAEKKEPSLEIYVYDDPEDHVYLHHDLPLAAFPLCTTWMTDGAASIAAVGTMLPFIEIWALDVIDAIEPAVLLGGCQKKQDNYRKKIKPSLLREDSHRDAVLCVQWNTTSPHILASGSADCSVKVWDLNTMSCVGTSIEKGSSNSEEKVQALHWHPQESNLLLSGGYEGTMSIRDFRQPQAEAIHWTHPNTMIENVQWGYEATPSCMVSTSNGEVLCYDPRMKAAGGQQSKGGAGGNECLWKINASTTGKEVTFAASRHIPGLLACGGADKLISLWDVRKATPTQITSRNFKTGGVFSLQFHPNHPQVLGACGEGGKPLVYTFTHDVQGIF